MNLLFRIILYVTIIAVFAFCKSYSQKISTPIEPEGHGINREIGIMAGLGVNSQSGTMLVDCENCLFENGSKFGYSVGALYRHELTNTFFFGLMVRYDDMSFDASYSERESANVYSEKTGEQYTVPLSFRHEANTTISYLSAIPFVEWEPFTFMFFRLGFSASIVSGANIIHKKQLVDRYVTLGEIDSVRVELAGGGYEATVEDGEIPDVGSLQLSALPMAGFTIDLRRGFFLSPYVSFALPLTNFSERGTDFKISQFRFMLELRYAFTVNKAKYRHLE